MFLHNRSFTHFHWIIGKDRNHDVFTSPMSTKENSFHYSYGEPGHVSHASWNAVEIALVNAQMPSLKPRPVKPKGCGLSRGC